VTLLRAVRKALNPDPDAPPVLVSAADPLNFRGILTPDEKVAPTTNRQLRVA